MADKIIEMCGLSKTIISIGIPMTKFRLEIVRTIIKDAKSDEIRKELAVMMNQEKDR